MVVAPAAQGHHGVAPGRVHCGTGRLVGPQVAVPSASERQYQQGWCPSGQPSGLSSHSSPRPYGVMSSSANDPMAGSLPRPVVEYVRNARGGRPRHFFLRCTCHGILRALSDSAAASYIPRQNRLPPHPKLIAPAPRMESWDAISPSRGQRSLGTQSPVAGTVWRGTWKGRNAHDGEVTEHHATVSRVVPVIERHTPMNAPPATVARSGPKHAAGVYAPGLPSPRASRAAVSAATSAV